MRASHTSIDSSGWRFIQDDGGTTRKSAGFLTNSDVIQSVESVFGITDDLPIHVSKIDPKVMHRFKDQKVIHKNPIDSKVSKKFSSNLHETDAGVEETKRNNKFMMSIIRNERERRISRQMEPVTISPR